ncbi:MAG TPA: hypothetical protein VGH29_13395 [Candidatus Binataceae bacterium]
MSQSTYVAGLWLLLFGAISCAARHDYAADGQRQLNPQTADAYESGFQQQALAATASLGDRPQIRDQARQAADVLKGLIGLIVQLPQSNPLVVSALTRDIAQLSSGLDAIADSHNDQQFTAAVFGMCEPEPMQASARVGPLLIGLGARIKINPPANASSDQVNSWAQYFDRLGETLVRIPQQCRLALKATAPTKAQVQSPPETEDITPKIQARRHHEATIMLLCIAGGMLAPSPNRYSISPMARLGRGLGQCQ